MVTDQQMREALEDLDIRPFPEQEAKVNESLRKWVKPTLDKHDRIRKLHFRHIDMHPVDPSVIHPNPFCCGKTQLGIVGETECDFCGEPYPCLVIRILDGTDKDEKC